LKQQDDAEEPWIADHRVRRFIRPVLMRDPQVALEEAAQDLQEEAQAAVASPQGVKATAKATAKQTKTSKSKPSP
jgi:hypothetical protein